MSYQVPGRCPVCSHDITIRRVSCSHCRTELEGEFAVSKFCRLPEDQLKFVEIFMKCRGNIKDVEKELGISYPTIRNRLDEIITALGHAEEAKQDPVQDKKGRQHILDALERGEITSQEAIRKLKQAGK